MKHTPGPWEIFDNREEPEDATSEEALIGITPASDRCDVAYCYIDTDRSEEEILANAKLIAAAPEMLDALKEVKHWLEGWASAEAELDFVNRIIAKATT